MSRPSGVDSEVRTPEVLESMAKILDGLRPRYTRKELAELVGQTSSYLSQVLPTARADGERKNKEGTPRRPSVTLIRTLLVVARTIVMREPATFDPEVLERIDRLADLLRLDVAGARPEPGQPLSGDSPYYIEREADAWYRDLMPVQGRLEVPAVRGLTGGPLIGKSSLLNRIATRFSRAGGDVVSVGGWRGLSSTDVELVSLVREALVAAGRYVKPDTAAGARVPLQLADLLKAATPFRRAEGDLRPPLLVVVDDINTLPGPCLRELLSAFRLLVSARSTNGAFARSCVLYASSWSEVRTNPEELAGIVEESKLELGGQELGWFDEDGVTDLFRMNLIARPAYAKHAWRLARGQPLLTHLLANHSGAALMEAKDLLRTTGGMRYAQTLSATLRYLEQDRILRQPDGWANAASEYPAVALLTRMHLLEGTGGSPFIDHDIEPLPVHKAWLDAYLEER